MAPEVNDPLGAFCAHGMVRRDGAAEGPLAGLTFAVKDVIDVAGLPTGAGNPDWLATHGKAAESAPVVDSLLAAGATLVGKTQCDELAYSVIGENSHYGTPVNPRAPDRVPGGSSSGSAAAVAGGLADFALGTDTAGSVRIPASFCGLHGFRPTHGRVPVAGTVPLAPSFDAIGWLARDRQVLERVGQVLLGFHAAAPSPRQFLFADDAFALADSACRRSLQHYAEHLAGPVGRPVHITLAEEGLDLWRRHLHVAQAFEVWKSHGPWITKARPAVGPGVKERLNSAAAVREPEAQAARRERERITTRLKSLLGGGTVLCLPTAPGPAPLRGLSAGALEALRNKILCLTCPASLGGLPQVTIPMEGDPPLGLSLIAGPRGDDMLLSFAAKAGVDTRAG